MKKLCVTGFIWGVLSHGHHISNLLSSSWNDWLHSLLVFWDGVVVPSVCQASLFCSWPHWWFSQHLLQEWPSSYKHCDFWEDSSKNPFFYTTARTCRTDRIRYQHGHAPVVSSLSLCLDCSVSWGGASHPHLYIHCSGLGAGYSEMS